ncbi:MAG: hypothetical protein KF841_05705 [Phycisphaerae bacterium]|nr:hypothetical protein [Phycisphaerae bacterium]
MSTLIHAKRHARAYFTMAFALSCMAWAGLANASRADDGEFPKTVRVGLPADPQTVALSDIEALRTWRGWLAEQEFVLDRCGVDFVSRTFVLELKDAAQLALIESVGFEVSPFDPLDNPAANPADAVPRGPGLDPQYFDPDDITTILNQTAEQHPDITRVFIVGTTIEGRNILGIEISDNPGIDEDEPAILLNGLHHSREVVTPHIVVDAIQHLTNGYEAADPQIVAWVRNYKTICVPMVNLDGSARVFSGDLNHRKNMRPVCTTGTNNPGVDLNRNYPYSWGANSPGNVICERGDGSSGSTCSDSYRGASASSEPETLAMIALADTIRFTIAVSYHSYGRFIDYPYACNDGNPDNRMPEHAVVDSMMRGMAAAIQPVNGVTYAVNSPVAAGPVNGDDTSWYYAHRGTYPFIVEVGTSFIPAFSAVNGLVNENRAGWRYLFGRLGQARIDLHVRDGCTPIEAEVTLLNYAYDTGELPRYTHLPFGRWTYVVPPHANYTIRVSKPGYVTQDVPIGVENSPIQVVVQLEPLSAPSILKGDMNGDCIVDGSDIAGFSTAWLSGDGATPSQVAAGDFTNDCAIDVTDLALFVDAALNGNVCP